MNQILYGFHLIIGRFDIYRPNVPSLLAQKVLNLVLMIYTFSFIIFFTVVLKYIGIKNVLEYKWWFLIVAFLLTCIEDYILFEKDKKAIKYFQEFLLLNSSSDIKIGSTECLLAKDCSNSLVSGFFHLGCSNGCKLSRFDM